MTRAALVLATLSVLTGGCATWSGPDKAGPRPPDAKVVYKTAGGRDLRLHVFRPDGWGEAGMRPAIVFFHGGAWSGGDPAQFHPHCEALAGRGMVAMSAEYRVKTRDGTTPRDSVADAKSAVRWIRGHAREFGVDPNRLAAGGGSAGGQMAAAAGNLPGLDEPGEDRAVSSRPDALVLFNPVFDNGPGGFGYERVKTYWKEFSPLHHIGRHSPPTLVVLGTKDRLVPVKTAESYVRLMHDSGRRCDLRLYRGRGHGFFNRPGDFRRTMGDVEGFLESLGFLDPGESP